MTFKDDVFRDNRAWADRMQRESPDFFRRLSAQQAPEILWIGCSDSRVPANEITGMMPGEIFVHRNIANLVLHTDINCQSVIQFAINELEVQHVVVCGHYGCGGVKAALKPEDSGLIHHWLRHIKDLFITHRKELERMENREDRLDRLCELNVIAQVHNLAHSSTIQNAWSRGQTVDLHGWIYRIENGRLADLSVDISSARQVPHIFHTHS